MVEHRFLEHDEPPKNGRWIDSCDVVAHPTKAEVAEGNRQGTRIDTEDDGDAGFVKVVSTRALSEHDQAMEKARDLKQIMLDFGAPEVSIELLPGRPSSYGTWDSLFVVSDMSHHTVSRYSYSSLTPVLSLVKNGRSDLPGPLCNGYGGWDLCYRIITFGYANHPGEGGPFTVPALSAGTFTIPRDSARRYAWGTEWEGGIAESDWDKLLTNPRNGKKMTFREFMGRCNAALEKYHKIHERAHLEHSTWAPARKIDRLHYTAAEGIAEKAPYRDGGDWFDMATKAELKEVLNDVLPGLIQKNVGGAQIVVDPDAQDPDWTLNRVLRVLMNDEENIKAALTAQTEHIIAEVVSELQKLPSGSGPGSSTSLSSEQVQSAVETGVRKVLGGLDNA